MFPSSTRLVASKYSLTRLIGRGGMGEVYEATHKTTGRRVAVKRLNFIHRVADETTRNELMGRLKREARAMGALESAHIVQILDAGEDPETGEPFIVMEYLEGEDLSEKCRELGPLPVDLALRIVYQASLGLARAHHVGVVHRDVKPANIFLVRLDEHRRMAKILDFGIARIVPQQSGSGEQTDLTQTGNVMGSPEFMAPEQVRGFKTVDARADVWALGRVLFKLLTGQTPNQDQGAGFGAVLLGICTVPAPSVQLLAPWVPVEVAEILRRALSIPAEQRYADAHQMSIALRALIPNSPDILESMIASALLTKGTRVPLVPVRPVAGETGTLRMPAGSAEFEGDNDATQHTPFPGYPAPSSKLAKATRRSRTLLVIGLAFVSTGLFLTAGWYVRFAGKRAVAPVLTAPSVAIVVEPPPAPIVRTVPVKLPLGAHAEVDGIPVAVHDDGVLDLPGGLGSTHRVRVILGNKERITVVAITASGALPQEVVLSSLTAPVRP